MMAHRFVLLLTFWLLALSGGVRATQTTGAMVQIGTVANRPVTGGLYFITDDGQQRLTYYNGTAWVDVAPGLSSTGIISGSGAPVLPSSTPVAGPLVGTAVTAPATPTAGKGAIYVDSTSKNLSVKDDAGVIKHGVQTKTAVANSFVTAIADDGTVTVVQPAFSNLSGSVTNAMLAGSIDVTTKLTGQVPYANGGEAGSAATSATTGTMTVSMTTAVITIVPTGACTFNASGGLAGQLATFVITTSGTSSFVLTWGTNFKATATLATGTTTAKTFAVTFRCANGTQWVEISRTVAM